MNIETVIATHVSHTAVLDEAYERLHRTGPEFGGWLSNHGPMAADALARLGAADQVHRWVDGYARRVDAAPAELVVGILAFLISSHRKSATSPTKVNSAAVGS